MMTTRNARLGIYAGALIPLVFWVTLALCAMQFDGYDPFTNLVSELGAAGTPTRVGFAAGLVLCSLLGVAFQAGIRAECRRGNIDSSPALPILLFSFSAAGAAIFPLPHRLHGILGSPVILLPLSPVLALVSWRRLPRLRGLAAVAIPCFLLMALGFLAFLPGISRVGLVQRIFHLGWSIWFGYLSLGFAGLLGGPGDDRAERTANARVD